jgi:glycosyltransferase involved in cell wall biosynthesis
MENPLVSIIIVTFNAEKTLQNCLDSIFKQSYPRLEIIIIDGFSTDNTIEIINKNKDKISFWISEKDSGVYDAMNKSLQYAKGDRIYFLGADDLLLPDFSSIIYQLKDENTIYYGRSKFKKRIDGKKFNPFKLSKGNIIHQSIFYPKKVFSKYKYELKYPILADYYLNIKCYGDSDFKFEFLPYLVSIFAAGGLSGTTKDLQFLLDKDQLIKENFSKTIYYRYLFRKFKKKIGL